MALTDVMPGIVIPNIGITPTWATNYNATLFGLGTTLQIDALNEKVAFMGHIKVAGGGTGMTLNKIHFRAGIVTAGTANTVRIGTQNVTTIAGPGCQPDGTWNRYADIAQMTGLSGAAFNAVTMTTGVTTYGNGDLVAVVFDMTDRTDAAGVLVVAAITGGASQIGYPATNTYGASWGTSSTAYLPLIVFEFNDGGTTKWGTFNGGVIGFGGAITAFNSGTAGTDEYGLLFQSPIEFQAEGFYIGGLAFASNVAQVEVRLFSTPTGTPSQIAIATIEGDEGGGGTTGAGGRFVVKFAGSPVTIAKNTDYLISVRPTTTTNIQFLQYTIADAAHRVLMTGGTTLARYGRVDNTGAFSSSSTTILPMFGLLVSQLHDGTSSGGGMLVHPGLTGGIRG